MATTAADRVQGLTHRADAWQRSWPPAAFVVGVVRKRSDDRGGRLAALLAHYAFFSLFPLLLVVVTVSAYVLEGHESLRERLLDSIVARLPVIGDDLVGGTDALGGSALTIVVGLALALWAALAVMTSAQEAMDEIWGIARARRRTFVASRLHALGLMVLLGLVLASSIAVSAVAAFTDDVPVIGGLGLIAGSILINAAALGLAFWLLPTERPDARSLWPGALLGGIAYWALQVVGSAIVRHWITGASNTYGTFAIVIGLLSWLHLLAQVAITCAEINVVRAQRLWPRSLTDDGTVRSEGARAAPPSAG